MSNDVITHHSAAKNAVSFVKAKVPYGASNRASDCAESYAKHRKKIEGADPIARFRQIAEITMRTGAGNCNEQSITAFMFLYDRGIRPLAWMHLTSGTHAFVVLGRTPKSGADPSKWGETAVVCDPWNNEAYTLPAVQATGILQTKWGCGTATAQFGVE